MLASPRNTHFEIEITVLGDDVDLLSPGNNARVKRHTFQDLAALVHPELLSKYP